MKTFNCWINTLLVVLVCNSYAFSERPARLLTFEEALQIMSEENPALKQARSQIIQKEYEIKEKRGLYLPQVSLNAKAVTMSDKLHLDMTPVRDAILPLYETLGNYGSFSGVPNPDPATNAYVPTLPDDISTQAVREKMLEGYDEVAASEWDVLIQDKSFASVTADVVWPLMMGGKVRGANKAANVELGISQENLRHQEAVLLSELVARYYGLALGQKVVEVRKQTLDVMNHHHSNANKLFENGMIAKVELLHAMVSKTEAEREYKKALRNVEIIRTGFASTLYIDSAASLKPISPLFMNETVESIDYWLEEALINNPQLKQIEGKKELVGIKNQINKESFLPSVALVGTYNIAEKNLSPYAPEWVVGLGAKWTVFSGLGRNNAKKAGASMMDQVDYAQKKANADIEAYITKLYHELQMYMEQRAKLETSLQLANEYCESTEKAFNEGLATSLMVVDAHTKVAQVKALRFKSFYDYDVCLSQILQIAGTPQNFIAYTNGDNTITDEE